MTKSILPLNKTIIKRNNIIRIIVNDNKILSLDSLKIYNFIYMIFQYNRKSIEKSKEFEIKIPHTLLKSELEISNDSYHTIVKSALTELLDTTVIIKNFTNKNGDIVKEYQTKLISSWFNGKNKTDKKSNIYSITVTETLFSEMIKSGKEYTELGIQNIKSLSSSNHIRLYEFVKSYQNMKIQPEHSLENLNELFMTNIRFLSDIEKIIKRAIKAINKKTDIELSYTKDKKRKTITFDIIKQRKTKEDISKQKFAIAKNIEEKEIIDNLMKEN
jgi:plasmid replication initiation protein